MVGYKSFKRNYLYGKRGYSKQNIDGVPVYQVSKVDPVIPEWKVIMAYIKYLLRVGSA